MQRVHYPLFEWGERGTFRQLHAFHEKRTTHIVVAPMCVEALASVAAFQSRYFETSEAVFGFTLVVILWVSTFTLQVPAHDRLGNGFDKKAQARLVATNWIRTVSWSLRSLILLLVLARHLG